MAYTNPCDLENIPNIIQKQLSSSPLKRSILADNTNTSELLAHPRKRTHFSASEDHSPPPAVDHSAPETPDLTNKRSKPETPQTRQLETARTISSFLSSISNKFSIHRNWDPIRARATNTPENTPRTLPIQRPPPDRTMHPLVDPLIHHEPGGTFRRVSVGPTLKPWAASNLKREQDELSSTLSTSQRESIHRNVFSTKGPSNKTIFKNQIFAREQRQRYEELLASKSIPKEMLSSARKVAHVSSLHNSTLTEEHPSSSDRLSSSLLEPPPLPKPTPVSCSYARTYKPENPFKPPRRGHNTTTFIKPSYKGPQLRSNAKGQTNHPLFSCPSPTLDISARDTNTRYHTPPPPSKHAALTDQDDICIVSVEKGPLSTRNASTPSDPLLTYSSHNYIGSLKHNYDLRRIKKEFEKEELDAYNRKMALTISHGDHSPTPPATFKRRTYPRGRTSIQELNEKMEKLVNTVELDIGDSGMPGPGFQPVELGEEMESRVSNALIPSPAEEVLSSGFRLHIKRKDMSTLTPKQWLNDEIINFYCSMLADRSAQKTDTQLPTVHTFNTFFYPQLKDRGYDSIKRWTRKVDIFKFDLITVPIHLGMHWCMSLIDFRSKSITYYDSFLGNNEKCLNILLEYLKRERLDKKGDTFDTSSWRLVHEKDIPEQRNSSDCGVFACQFAEFLTRDAAISFNQDDMPVIRRQMVAEILRKQLYH